MSSSRGMIHSMLLIGSAQAMNIFISLVRIKLLALMLGPVGVGLLAIWNSLQDTAGTLAGLGLGSSGVREIAAAKEDPAVLSRVRRILFAANLVQGVVAMAVVWFLREPIALWLTGSAAHAAETGLVGVAVLLSLVATSQTALLQGLRRIADLGRVTVLSAFAGTIVGLLAVWLRGEDGLIWFLIAQPATAVLVAMWFTRRLPAGAAQPWTLAAVWRVWKPMAALGVVFMLAGLASTATVLVARGMIGRELGLEAAGLFAASWAIAITYIGFLLSAMGADYYPRLVEVIGDPVRANRLMNDQMQIGLALGGPILLVLIGLAPWVMAFLYSRQFIPAAEMLQWQALGNVLKLASWPLGFVLVAAARSKTFLWVELGWNALFLGILWAGLSSVGLALAGIGFVVAYAVYFLALWWIVARSGGFRFAPLSGWLLVTHLVLAAITLALARTVPHIAAVVGVLLALVSGLAGVRVVLIKIGPDGRLAIRLTAFFARIGWPVQSER